MSRELILGDGYRAWLGDGREVLIRAARCGDEPLIQRFVRGLSLVSRYQRFFLSLRELPAAMLDHLVRSDPRAEAALLALTTHGDGSADAVGLVHYVTTFDASAEVAVVVADAWRRTGLATRLLADLVQVAACAGLTHVEADILRDNVAAIKLAGKLGASPGTSPNGRSVVRVSRALAAAAEGQAGCHQGRLQAGDPVKVR
jgi:acetyltransferase